MEGGIPMLAWQERALCRHKIPVCHPSSSQSSSSTTTTTTTTSSSPDENEHRMDIDQDKKTNEDNTE